MPTPEAHSRTPRSLIEAGRIRFNAFKALLLRVILKAVNPELLPPAPTGYCYGLYPQMWGLRQPLPRVLGCGRTLRTATPSTELKNTCRHGPIQFQTFWKESFVDGWLIGCLGTLVEFRCLGWYRSLNVILLLTASCYDCSRTHRNTYSQCVLGFWSFVWT